MSCLPTMLQSCGESCNETLANDVLTIVLQVGSMQIQSFVTHFSENVALFLGQCDTQFKLRIHIATGCTNRLLQPVGTTGWWSVYTMQHGVPTGWLITSSCTTAVVQPCCTTASPRPRHAHTLHHTQWCHMNDVICIAIFVARPIAVEWTTVTICW